MERNHQHLKALAGFSILLLEPNQGGNVEAIARSNNTIVTYHIALTKVLGVFACPNNSTADQTFKICPGGYDSTSMHICNTYALASNAIWTVIGI